MCDDSEHINESISDVICLLEREIERLKASLETFRIIEHKQKDELIRWHIRTLDERQDMLDDLRRMSIESRAGLAIH
ncbi:MAG: hypothetical protein KUG75_01870 [Pseudomonadales bacterium]|nr:hypothetical protein [Pseudomonadales bacterium]